MFHVANDCAGGEGDPPLSAPSGVGGLGPILINGQPYGVGNLCRAPAVCSPTGDIPAAAKGYVVQRNNLTYGAQQSKKVSTGKTILATSESEVRQGAQKDSTNTVGLAFYL